MWQMKEKIQSENSDIAEHAVTAFLDFSVGTQASKEKKVFLLIKQYGHFSTEHC